MVSLNNNVPPNQEAFDYHWLISLVLLGGGFAGCQLPAQLGYLSGAGPELRHGHRRDARRTPGSSRFSRYCQRGRPGTELGDLRPLLWAGEYRGPYFQPAGERSVTDHAVCLI